MCAAGVSAAPLWASIPCATEMLICEEAGLASCRGPCFSAGAAFQRLCKGLPPVTTEDGSGGGSLNIKL